MCRFDSSHIIISIRDSRSYSHPSAVEQFAGDGLDGLRQMLAALLLQYKDHGFFAPPVFPQEFGTTVFRPLKFSLDPLNRSFMRREASTSRSV
jgi:hypothetical protein